MNETKRAVNLAEQLPGARTTALEDVEAWAKVTIDHIFWRLVQLACVLFFGTALLIWLGRKRAKNSKSDF